MPAKLPTARFIDDILQIYFTSVDGCEYTIVSLSYNMVRNSKFMPPAPCWWPGTGVCLNNP